MDFRPEQDEGECRKGGEIVLGKGRGWFFLDKDWEDDRCYGVAPSLRTFHGFYDHFSERAHGRGIGTAGNEH